MPRSLQHACSTHMAMTSSYGCQEMALIGAPGPGIRRENTFFFKSHSHICRKHYTSVLANHHHKPWHAAKTLTWTRPVWPTLMTSSSRAGHGLQHRDMGRLALP